MPAVTRLGDSCTGHGTWPPRPSTGGSGDVFVNGIPAHRQGDAWAVHCNDVPVCHAGSLAAGSGTVFVNGKQLGRVGDSVSCGSAVAAGSGNVFAGG
ncbi:PAAR domain-containing protein [uncultured Tolumonas sp.]|uniref:PAAR domain-containing protein n=1 Tax=uncultured Tolumonas sp. TaxID=263765 RepID=UPI00374A3A70